MAKKPSSTGDQKTYLTVAVEDAEKRIDERIKLGEGLKAREINSHSEYKVMEHDYFAWNDYNGQLLKTICTTNELSRKYSPAVGVGGLAFQSLGQKIDDLKETIDHKLGRLRSVRGLLSLFAIVPSTDTVDSVPESIEGSPTIVLHNSGTINNPNFQVGLSGLTQSVTIGATHGEVLALLTELRSQTDRIRGEFDAESQRQMDQAIQVVTSEVESVMPRRAWWKMGLDDVADVAKRVGDIGKPILDIATRLAPLLLEYSKHVEKANG